MKRSFAVSLVAAAALAAVTFSLPAFARGGGGGGGHGGFGGAHAAFGGAHFAMGHVGGPVGGFGGASHFNGARAFAFNHGGPAFHHDHGFAFRHRFAGNRFFVFGAPYFYGGYGDDCYVPVNTAWGWRWEWVCY